MMRAILLAAALLAASVLPGAADCLKNPDALFAYHTWAVKMSSGCWVGADAKPALRGNRGHHAKHRKEVMHSARSAALKQAATARPETSPLPAVATAGGTTPMWGTTPIFRQSETLSQALGRCADEWIATHDKH